MDSSKFAEKKGIMRMSKGKQHNMNYNKLSIFETDDLREICHYHDCKCYYCLARPYLQEEKRECWERKSAWQSHSFLFVFTSPCAQSFFPGVRKEMVSVPLFNGREY